MLKPTGRVAILMHDLRGGGAERIMLRLASEFVARGLEVDLVLVQKRGEYLSILPDGARVIDLNRASVLSAVPAIAKYLATERPQAMLAALTHVNIAAVLARLLAPFSGTRIVLSERNQISRKAASAKGLRDSLQYWLVPFLYPRAAAITAVSEGVAEDLARFAKLPAARVRTIYNPITDPRMLEAAKAECPHPWLNAKSAPVILAVGRLTHQKGFDILLEAFAKVRQRLDCRLIILGDGDERANLEAMTKRLEVEADVSMPGFAGNPHCYMSRADLFVLSSRWEGLPGVLIEAMYCGAAVVATDCPSGPSEILEGGKYGALETHPAASVARAAQFDVASAVSSYAHALEIA
jgi:glycosyltransferase involved in cell wall biosynthesis